MLRNSRVRGAFFEDFPRTNPQGKPRSSCKSLPRRLQGSPRLPKGFPRRSRGRSLVPTGRPRRRFWGVLSLDFRFVFRSFFRSNLPSIFRLLFDLVCSSCRVDRGSTKRRGTLILCALSRFLKVVSTSRILADTMKVSSSDRRSSKSRSKKS